MITRALEFVLVHEISQLNSPTSVIFNGNLINKIQ